jgi:hypothetical protein
VSVTYSYQLVDLVSSKILAEVPMSGVRFSKVLNDSGTFEGTLSLDKVLLRKGINGYDMTTPCRTCVYVLRDGVPLWGGIIWTRAYDSTSKKISIGAADFWSYYDHRKVIPVITWGVVNQFYLANQVSQAIQQDQNVIARAHIQLADLHVGGAIGITLDTSLSGILRDRVYPGFDLTDVGDALRKLANVLDGPDIMFDVSGDNAGNVIRQLRIGTPKLGQQGSTHIWEYGGNIQSYRWPSDGTKMATRIFAVGDGIERGMPIAVSEDESRYFLGWPMLEEEHGYSTVSAGNDLQAHADADQIAQRAPVVLPELVVRGDIPPVLGTYGPGDDARIIIQDEFHVDTLDVGMRIVRMEVSPSEAQGEKVVVTMAPLIDEVTF